MKNESWVFHVDFGFSICKLYIGGKKLKLTDEIAYLGRIFIKMAKMIGKCYKTYIQMLVER